MEIRKIIAGLLCLWMLAGCTSVKEKNVVCAGDSITCGYLLSEEESYPSVLQGLLGKDYVVTNVSNVGLSAYDYLNMWYLDQAKEVNPDIVVLMFGSNDSNPAFYQSEDVFESYYTKLIDAFSGSKIYLCTPCKAYSSNYGVNENNLEKIVETIKKIGKEKDLVVIDIYDLSSQHEEWFEEDGVHPNSQGAAQIAQTIYGAMQE